MFGVMAYVDSDITPQPCLDEVEQARWFSSQELSEALERVKKNPALRTSSDNDPTNFFVPPRGAIANLLLKTWLKDFAKYSS
jgi:NADH pyrophosphatase NudC (nudix superfamily)